MENTENDLNKISDEEVIIENNPTQEVCNKSEVSSSTNDNLEKDDLEPKETNPENDTTINNSSTDLIEYKEIEEPCVALTIIGENKLSNTEVFIKRGIKYSIKAFFSGLILTIMNMFL